MHNLTILGLLVLMTSACSSGDSEGKVNSDEAHRAADWESVVDFRLTLDTVNDDLNKSNAYASRSTASLEELVDQLFEMSFTGDAQVYAPSILGELDAASRLDPEDFLDHITQYDSMVVEDLITGELKDTVIDVSFSKSSTSALMIYSDVSDDGGWSITPKYVGIGKQVFDVNTGRYRGISLKFFVQVGESLDLAATNDALVLQTDSTGIFRMTGFQSHSADTDQSLSEMLIKAYGNTSDVQGSFHMTLDYSAQRLYIEEVGFNVLPAL